MSAALTVWVPFLPPSSNSIYRRNPVGKGMTLSDKARLFKGRAMRVIQKQGRVAFMHLKQNVPYELRLIVFFKAVEVKSSKVGARYRKIDLSNMIKLIEDTAAEAVGVDDSHNFRIVLEKHCDPENPGLYVRLTEIPENRVGLTKEEYDQLQQDKPDRVGRLSPTQRFLAGASRRR